MRWFFPSWNGDIRIESHPAEEHFCQIVVHSPTAGERRVLRLFHMLLERREARSTNAPPGFWDEGGDERQVYEIRGPLHQLGPLLCTTLRPGVATLTAISIEGGNVTAMGVKDPGFWGWLMGFFGKDSKAKDVPSGTTDELAGLLQRLTAEFEKEERRKTPYRRPAPDLEPAKAAKDIVTVSRPTLCCPDAVPGPINPAREVLNAFLSDQQRDQWESERSIVATGSHTGHRYLLAHRHTERARRFGKIAYDLDDGIVVHFHDWSVPPEEEVLAAMLILSHREPWLRNEATTCGGEMVFKNPFGNFFDGVPDANLLKAIGRLARTLEARHSSNQLRDAIETVDRCATSLGRATWTRTRS